MKIRLSQALLKRYGPMPETFETHVDASLLALTQKKEEIHMRRKSIPAVALIAALLVLTTGAALALNSLGMLDFLDRTPSKQVQDMVQSNLKNNVFTLEDCTITVKEALSDGFSGSLVVEYSVPEGMYLYAPDARAIGTYSGAETTPLDVLLSKYTAVYAQMDPRIGWLRNGELDAPGSEYGFDPVKVADNKVIVHIGFTVEEDGLDNFAYRPSVFKVPAVEYEKWERLRGEPAALGMLMKAENNVKKTAKVPKELADMGVTAIDVTLTPLTMVVEVAFKEETALFPKLVDESGNEVGSDFLSSFALAGEQKAGLTQSRGYTLPDPLPETLKLQLVSYTNKGENPASEAVQITLE